MNKYFWLIGILVLILVIGFGYRRYGVKETDRPIITGQIKEITVTAQKDEWRFAPEEIELNQGDRVIMTVVNEDSYDHGLGIDAFGISQRLPANQTITVEFDVTKAGDFPFYCSVPCGGGDVAGVYRDHFSMVGKLKVKSLVQVME